MFLSFLCVIAALFLDYKFAEPKRWHPLVGFGRYVNWLDQKLNLQRSQQSSLASVRHQELRGLVAMLLAVLPVLFVLSLIQHQLPQLINVLLDIAILYLCIGWSSLQQHAQWVYQELLVNNISLAREKLAWIVSRETEQLDGTQVAQGTVESILENSSDALFASIFWFILLGAEGVVLHRMVNTLDAMWGYKNQKYRHFGRFSAQFDDVLNYIPARLTAYAFVFCARSVQAGKDALACWRSQASQCASPNGGPVMTAGAGALSCRLSDGAYYHGEWKAKPIMGRGENASLQTIPQALNLVQRSLIFWVMTIGGLSLVIG